MNTTRHVLWDNKFLHRLWWIENEHRVHRKPHDCERRKEREERSERLSMSVCACAYLCVYVRVNACCVCFSLQSLCAMLRQKVFADSGYQPSSTSPVHGLPGPGLCIWHNFPPSDIHAVSSCTGREGKIVKEKQTLQGFMTGINTTQQSSFLQTNTEN